MMIRKMMIALGCLSLHLVTCKDLAFLKQKLLLPTAGNRAAKTTGRVEVPTAGNRAAKTAGRVDSQVLYYPIFTTFAHHTMSENILYYTNIVKDVIGTTSTARLSNTNCLAEYNAEVASWNTKHKDNNSSSTSIFDENVGEDLMQSFLLAFLTDHSEKRSIKLSHQK
jgi:hypothetical protein